MSMRIRRRFGYGLVVDKGDPRVDWERAHAITEELLPAEEALTRERYLDFLNGYSNGSGWVKQHAGMLLPEAINFASTLKIIVDEDGMYDDKVAVLITPPMLLEEAHEVDTLFLWGDYETNHPEKMDKLEALVTEFRLHPYPYTDTLVDRETRDVIKVMEARRYVRDGFKPEDEPHPAALRKTPYASVEELAEKSRLLPPADALVYIEWLRVFKDLETVESVKPLAVTYFS